MANCFYWIPVISMLSSIAAFLLAMGVLLQLKSWKKILAQEIVKGLNLHFFKNDEKRTLSDLESIVLHLLNGRLEDLESALRREIPLANMFLTPTVSAKLKEQARKEIIKMVPELKEIVLKKVSGDLNIGSILTEKTAHLTLWQGFNLTKRLLWHILAAIALFGLLFGILQAWIIVKFCS